MTRGQIVTQGIQWSRRPQSDAAIEDIFSLYARLDAIVLDWTQPYRVLPLTRRTGITSGSGGPICLPDGMHWVDRCSILTSDGEAVQIRVMNSVDADHSYGEGWRTSGSSGQPRSLIVDGPQNFFLYPAPNYTAASGLTLYGRGVILPGSWAAETDECPLQEQHHLGLAACITDFILEDCDEYVPPARRDRYRREARRAKQNFIVEAGQITMSDHRNVVMTGRAATSAFNPLEL